MATEKTLKIGDETFYPTCSTETTYDPSTGKTLQTILNDYKDKVDTLWSDYQAALGVI